MAMAKETTSVFTQGNSFQDEEFTDTDSVVSEKKGTRDDQRNMWRMGKAQEMKRNFRFLSMFGLTMLLMATWETALGVATIGLLNGGTAGIIWDFLFTWVGFLMVYASMAEMGSMSATWLAIDVKSFLMIHPWAPTSDNELAPPKLQKFLSFIVGWLCVLGWQTGASSTSFLAGTQIQGLLVLNYPNYVFERWHGTLLVFAVSAFSVLFNTVFAKRLPLVETVVLFVHIGGFFAVLITLLVMAPHSDAKSVFTQFTDSGGWGNNGLSACVGILGAIIPLLGADAAVHMSEELRDAGKTLPRAMIITALVNGLMGFIMLIVFCFCLGDIDAAIVTPTGYAFIEVFYNATGSKVGTSILSALVIFQSIFCNLSIVATASRQLYAFARDKGVPFGRWVAYVPSGWDVPVNAVLVSFMVSCLLALINIGSTVAFNSISSLSTGALLTSYIISNSCMLRKRWLGEPLLPSHFSLGRYGSAIHTISIVFLIFIMIFSFFPGDPNPTPAFMNWGVLIYGVFIIFSLVYYFVVGRHHYDGPVEYVKRKM